MIREDIEAAKVGDDGLNADFQTYARNLNRVVETSSQPISWNPLQWMKIVDEEFKAMKRKW
jgi:hypothetical protein